MDIQRKKGLLDVCVLAVLRPLKVTLTNFPEHETVELDAPYNGEDPSWGSRKLPLTRELYIEREDFMETPVKGWFRLSPKPNGC